MRQETLDRLLEARAAKRKAALLRWLGQRARGAGGRRRGGPGRGAGAGSWMRSPMPFAATRARRFDRRRAAVHPGVQPAASPHGGGCGAHRPGAGADREPYRLRRHRDRPAPRLCQRCPLSRRRRAAGLAGRGARGAAARCAHRRRDPDPRSQARRPGARSWRCARMRSTSQRSAASAPMRRGCERLAALGHDDAALDRIHGPAGLSLGAVSPAEIAIAVMAEMTRRALRQGPGASRRQHRHRRARRHEVRRDPARRGRRRDARARAAGRQARLQEGPPAERCGRRGAARERRRRRDRRQARAGRRRGGRGGAAGRRGDRGRSMSGSSGRSPAGSTCSPSRRACWCSTTRASTASTGSTRR